MLGMSCVRVFVCSDGTQPAQAQRLSDSYCLKSGGGNVSAICLF